MDPIRTLKIILLAAALIGAIIFGKKTISGIIEHNRYGKTYEQGCKQLEKGEYENARNSFEKTRGYKDSDTLILKSYYLEAEQYFGKGEYAKAEKAYEQAGTYMDAKEKRLLSIYKDAERYESEGNTEMAMKRFTDAGDYKDSAERAEKNRLALEEEKTFVVNYEIDERTLDMTASSEQEFTFSKMSVRSMNGTFSESGQELEFPFAAENGGWYSLVVNSGKTTAYGLTYKVLDKNGNEVKNWNSESLLDARQIRISEPGTYKLIAASNSAKAGDTFDAYWILAKTVIDLCKYPVVHDYIEDMHQLREYQIKPTISGKYTFEFPEMSNGMNMEGQIRNSAGKIISSTDWWSHDLYKSGYSKEVELKGGETYTFYVFPMVKTGAFTLKFHNARETVDISSYTEINDEITYKDQQNKYTFTPKNSGGHCFSIGKLYGNSAVQLIITDDYDKTVAKEDIDSEGGSVRANLEEGKEYTVLVKQRTGTSKYTLSVGNPNPMVDISGFETVKDTMRFAGQENQYWLTPSDRGNYRLSVGPMNSNQQIMITIKDRFDHAVIKQVKFMSEDVLSEPLALDSVQEYTIYVTQVKGLGPYSIKLEGE